ncbi:MAG: hypothetical protein ACMUJM_18605 [bacterium]
MKRFYKVAITKVPLGTAIEYREPPLQGKVVIKVSDTETAGSYQLFVVECDDTQNRDNIASPFVSELSEEEAVKLAAHYQPQRTVIRHQPQRQGSHPHSRLRMREKITLPACDLKKFL